MKSLKHVPHFFPRTLMFIAEIALVAFIFRPLLPVKQSTSSEPGLDLIGEIGFYIVMVTFGAGLGFWFTFGDLMDRGE